MRMLLHIPTTSCLLSLAISCTVLASGRSATASETASLQVGAVRVDITPVADSTSLPSGKYEHEQLYFRAIVLDNGITRAALIGADRSGLSEQLWLKRPNKLRRSSNVLSKTFSCPRHILIVPLCFRWGNPVSRLVRPSQT